MRKGIEPYNAWLFGFTGGTLSGAGCVMAWAVHPAFILFTFAAWLSIVVARKIDLGEWSA